MEELVTLETTRPDPVDIVPTASLKVRDVIQLAHVQMFLRRVLQGIPVMVGVTFLTFTLMNLLPGGSATALAGPGATPAEIHRLSIKLHLNLPFFTRYWDWITGAITGNFGKSLANGEPVSQLLASRVPITGELILFAMLASLVLAIPVAVIAANRPNGAFDRASGYVSMSGLAVPNFVLALVLILIFAVKLQVLPAIGFSAISSGILGNLQTMVLPAAALGVPLFCSYQRVLRADLIEQLQSEDYVVAATAKGISRARVLVGHALPNALFSVLTLVGLNLGVLIGGTVLIEEIFGLPGIGQALIVAINNQDVPVVEGIVAVLALAVVVANLLTDVAYTVIDPRIRYGRAKGVGA